MLSAVLQLSAINRTPVACDRAVSKLLLRCCNGTDRQTDRPTDSVPLHSHCCAHYAGSANSVLQYADICWRPLFNRKLCTTKLTVGLRCLVGIGRIVNQQKATEMLRHIMAYSCTAYRAQYVFSSLPTAVPAYCNGALSPCRCNTGTQEPVELSQ